MQVDHITLEINGEKVQVPKGMMLSAALAIHEVKAFRQSVQGEARYPLCGMGICQECRVEVNGLAFQKACETACVDAMKVRTDV